jgi:hypothetical protein
MFSLRRSATFKNYPFTTSCLLKTQKIELNIMLLNVTITFVGYNKSDEVRAKCTQNKKQTPAKIMSLQIFKMLI